MSDYDSHSIEIVQAEMRTLFDLTEARSREHLQKSQVLLGVAGVMLTLWTNAILRLFSGAPAGVVGFLAVLTPLGLLTIGASYCVQSIVIGDHEVPDKDFLLKPETWRKSPERVRVANMKALSKSVETNEMILSQRQRRYKKALGFVRAGLVTVAVSAVWLLYNQYINSCRGS